MNRRAWIPLLLLVIEPLHAGAQTKTRAVSIELVESAARSPWDFAQRMSVEEIPGGVVVDDVDMPQRGRTAPPSSSTGSATLLEALAGFNRQHSSYQARDMAGVVVIRPTSDLPSYVSSSAPTTVRAHGLLGALRKLFAPIDPAVDRPGGVVGPGLGGDIDRGETLDVVIDGRGKTVLDVLNDLARLAPGQVWAIETSKDQSTQRRLVRVGFIHHGVSESWLSLAAR